VSKLFCQEKVVTTVSGKPAPRRVHRQVQKITTTHRKPDGSRW
jgi:hypothetical protein